MNLFRFSFAFCFFFSVSISSLVAVAWVLLVVYSFLITPTVNVSYKLLYSSQLFRICDLDHLLLVCVSVFSCRIYFWSFFPVAVFVSDQMNRIGNSFRILLDLVQVKVWHIYLLPQNEWLAGENKRNEWNAKCGRWFDEFTERTQTSKMGK